MGTTTRIEVLLRLEGKKVRHFSSEILTHSIETSKSCKESPMCLQPLIQPPATNRVDEDDNFDSQ